MKFVIKKSKNGRYWYFILKARNSEIVATSEMYNSKQAAKKGINAVRKSLFAGVEDLTI
jgi:uncharacterized protein YegP (UPF0339 family)